MLANELCVPGTLVAIPKQKSIGSSITFFQAELEELGWTWPYLVVNNAGKFKDTDEFMFCDLARPIGLNGEDGWLRASNFSSEDLELYKPGYWDVAFRVGDVLLLTDDGTQDADSDEMDDRCCQIIYEACDEFGLDTPQLFSYPYDSDEQVYDSVGVRDYYINQLRRFF
jgi:hypothetical protein